MLSYPENITTCRSTQQLECSPTTSGIQKSLQNTSPQGINAAVKSVVIRLLVSSKVQNSSAISLSIRGNIDLGLCTVISLWTNQKQV